MFKTRIIMLAAVLALCGAVMIFSGVSDTVKLNGDVPDFNYESMQSLKKGDFVQGYVENILDCYANETTTEKTLGIETSSRTSGEYFIMPLVNEEDVDKDLYITVTGKNVNDRKMLYDISDTTWKYINGETDIEWIDMPIVAKVKPLDKELTGYMTSWFRQSGWFDGDEKASDAEIQSHIVPYELVIYRVKSASEFIIAGSVMLLISAAVFAVMIAMSKRSAAPAYDNYTPPQAVPSSDKSAGGSFSENFTAEPMPYIPQPVQPDDFFAKPDKKQAAAPSPKEEKPAEEKAPEAVKGNMDGLDTSALDFSVLDSSENAEENTDDEFSV